MRGPVSNPYSSSAPFPHAAARAAIAARKLRRIVRSFFEPLDPALVDPGADSSSDLSDRDAFREHLAHLCECSLLRYELERAPLGVVEGRVPHLVRTPVDDRTDG